MDHPLSTTISLHQSEAERLFVGAVMIDEQYAREACGWLAPEMFRDERIREFWGKVLAGTQAHAAAMEIGAYYDYILLASRVPTSRDLPAFANTISLDNYLSKSAQSLSEMARAVADRDTDNLRSLARAIADNAPASSDVIPSAVDIGLEFQAALGDVVGRSEITGIPSLDAATGGLENQTLTIIAARPSMGKSALGIQVVKWKAECQDKRNLLFSLEMNRISIWARIACGELKLSWRDVRAGKVDETDMQALRDKSSDLMDRLEDRLLVDDTSRMTTEDIWRKVGLYRPDFVVVDHMGLVASREKDEVLALGQISRELKTMSKQFDIPVVALYQLNRGTEARDNKRPTMADIRGSGKIEENADNIFFLYRPDYYDDAKPTAQTVSKTELIVAKFRDGVRNIGVNLHYHLDEQWFYSERRLP